MRGELPSSPPKWANPKLSEMCSGLTHVLSIVRILESCSSQIKVMVPLQKDAQIFLPLNVQIHHLHPFLCSRTSVAMGQG